MTTVTIDPARQKRAKQYARSSRRLMLLDLLVGGAYATLWLLPLLPGPTRNLAAALKAALLQVTQNEWLLVAAFGAVFGGLYYLVTLPLSFYSSYLLPKQYELSNDNLAGWISDQVKSVIIGGLLGGLLLEIIYALLRLAPETWWLWAAGIMLLFNVILSNLAPVLLFPLFYKFVPLDQEYRSLAERLVNLAERAGTRVEGVYQFDMSRRTKTANAALTGLGSTRRIILGDTLLSEFTEDEIETVLAHELGHQAHRDIPLGILSGTIITLLGFYLAGLGLRWGTDVLGFAGPADIAALPLFSLVMGLFGLFTMPLSNLFSRWRERLADAFALRLTGKAEAYASALARLANQNLADADPEPWVEWLLYSHPALGKRIQMAKAHLQQQP